MKLKTMILSPFQTNCYILSKDNNTIIIDPGDNGKKISNYLEENELNLQAILLTHGHIDHIGAIDYLYNKYQCNIYLDSEDVSFLRDASLNLASMLSNNTTFNAPVINPKQKFDIADFQIETFKTPGHTPGSLMYLIDNEYLFSGDMLFESSIGRTDFPGSSSSDMKNSIQLIKTIDKDYTVYPGHGNTTTIFKEKQNNPFF